MSQDNNNQGNFNYGAGNNAPHYYQQTNGGYRAAQNGNPMSSNHSGQQNTYGYPQSPYQPQQLTGQYRNANPMPQQPRPVSQPDPEQPKQQKPEKKKPSVGFGETLSRLFVGTLTLFIVVYMGWLFAPRIRNSMTFWPTNTPTPVTPSPTVPATATVTPLATNTPTAMPTATPGPISTYWIASGSGLDPAVPNAPDGLVILSAKNSADVDPALDSVYWTSSSQIVQDLGKINSLYDSEWFATLNPGSIRFFMDRSLKEGLYEIYVMDTFYSSGGTLDYQVKVGEQEVSPLTSSQTVEFMTSQYDPRQSMDTWRSIGIYYLPPSIDVLTVSTSWGYRDEYTYVAADRVMIVPRRSTDLSLLNELPSVGTKYIMDDTEADITAGNSLFHEDVSRSWDDSYQLILNPKTKATIEYSSKEPWPIGAYSIFMYIPENKGGIDAEIQVFTDNTLLETLNGESTVKLHMPTGGEWVLIGQYNTDRYYERPVKFKVTITIPEGQSGEFPVDALAFIQQPYE